MPLKTMAQALDAAQQMLSRWPSLRTAVVTCMAGYVLVQRHHESAAGFLQLMLPRRHHPVVEAIGAGDAFVGGFVAASCRQLCAAQALVWAHCTAMLSTQHVGAQDSMPTWGELCDCFEAELGATISRQQLTVARQPAPVGAGTAGGLPSRQQSDTRDRAARIALIMDNKPVDGGAGAIRTDRRQPGVRSESAIEVVDGGTGTKRSPNTGPPERLPNTGPGRTSSKDLHSDRTRVPPDAPMSPIALQRNSRTVLPGSGPDGVAEGGGGPQTPVSENLKRSSRGSVERTSESPPRTQTPLVSSGTRFYANVVNKQVRHREGLRVRAVGSVRCGNPVGV